MLFHGVRPLSNRFHLVRTSFQQADGLPFSNVLSQDRIKAAIDRYGITWASDIIFTAPIVLWAFLSQVLHKEEGRSCLAAVVRIRVMMIALGRPPCAHNSGPYCRARGIFPEGVIRDLAHEVASASEDQIPEEWLWNCTF